jgi:hypothetical protein
MFEICFGNLPNLSPSLFLSSRVQQDKAKKRRKIRWKRRKGTPPTPASLHIHLLSPRPSN